MIDTPELGPLSRARVTTRLLRDGVSRWNPVVAGNLGICSALAATVDLKGALLMAATVSSVLLVSTAAASALRNHIPEKIRLVVQMAIVSTLVTVASLLAEAWFPEIHRPIGPYLALVVTNCVILGRIESFARHNGPFFTIADAIGNAAGYSWVLVAVAVIRDFSSSEWVCGGFSGHPAGGFLALAAVLWAASASGFGEPK